MPQYLPSRRPAPLSNLLAEVAELPDAHGSGPCTRKGVGVRVPSSAPLLLLSSTCKLVIPTLIPHQGKGHHESAVQCHEASRDRARLALLPRCAVREWKSQA